MKTAPRHFGFTLIELLVVIAIIGILAAIAMPTLSRFRAGDSLAAGVRQIQDDVARARQLALSQRTTVYMVFCPPGFWDNSVWNSQSAYNNLNPHPDERRKAEQLFGKQLTGYAFVTLRSVGDQPGRISPRYLSNWQSLPEGVVIPEFKFGPPGNFMRIVDTGVTPNRNFDVYGLPVTNNIPFPSEAAQLIGEPYVWLPYIAFNHLGQLIQNPFKPVGADRDEFIPVARGSVSYPRVNGVATNTGLPTITESPPGNSTNNFMLVRIDWLTGRARVEKQEFR